MGEIKAILYKDFKNLYYKKYIIFFSLFYFIFIFYFLINFTYNINEIINMYIINNDEENIYINDFIQIFKTDKSINLTYDKNINLNYSIIQKLYGEKKYNIIIVINKGFSQDLYQYKQTRLEVFIFAENELKRHLYLSFLYKKLEDYFITFKNKTANKLQNVTGEEYTSYIEFLAKPFTLDVTWFRISQVPYKNFSYFSFLIQTTFFSLFIISALIVNNDISGNFLVLIKRSRFIFLKVLVSKILVLILFFTSVIFIFLLISFVYNITIKGFIDLILIVFFVALFSIGLGIIIGVLLPIIYILTPFIILITFIFALGGFFLPNLNILFIDGYFPLYEFLQSILNYEISNISYDYNKLSFYFEFIIFIVIFSLILYYIKIKKLFS